MDSFTISFWIYPSSYSNDEAILKIGSEYFDTLLGKVIDQSINAKIKNSRIYWEFKNIFTTLDKTKELLVLDSYSRIMPEKWWYITLSFDSHSGIIRENINDNEEGIILATEDGSLKSTVYNLRFHRTNRCVVTIAPSFYGAIDEFCITKNNNKSNFIKYNSPNGEITSNVSDFGSGGIMIQSIIPDDNKKNNADIVYYYRYSNSPFDENDEFSNDIKWKISRK